MYYAGGSDHVETPRGTTSATKDDLVILLWTWPFGDRFPLDQCARIHGISGCTFTVERTWYSRADAVILHHRDVCSSKDQLPQKPRPQNQRWVWFNLESPRHSPNLHFMDNLINLTLNYRSDADIFSPYGWVESVKSPQDFNIPNKTKLVAWVVSNWDSSLARVAYYNDLKNHINIDIYGGGSRPLARDKTISTISQYKFYLSFENSLNQDYITEKLWHNALLSGTLPVVLGPTRENYERFLPSDAFIHVSDFPSAKELAAHLRFLDANDEQYRRYFEWRKRLQPVGSTDWTTHYCKACQVLQQQLNYKTIPSIAKWYQ
ncbi:3-galactosyl-N-acetylglucosaminide 4-alpha-L-fucosyltransferase FUT3-like [Lissotriton helveticus]